MDEFKCIVYVMKFADNSRIWVYHKVDESVDTLNAPPGPIVGDAYHARYTEWWKIQYILRLQYIYGRLEPDVTHQDIVQLDVYQIHRFPFYITSLTA